MDNTKDNTSALTTLRVAFFLAFRDIRRANIWTTILIVFVMMLTFINLVVVGGILVGIPVGAGEAYRERYTGDVMISTLPEETYISESSRIINIVKAIPEIESFTDRYIERGIIETGYKEKTHSTDSTESVGVVAVGINPEREYAVTNLSGYIVEGRELEITDFDKIVVGSNILYKYAPLDSPSEEIIRGAGVGSKVRLMINGNIREVTIVGVSKTKSNEADRRVYMTAGQLRQLTGRTDLNVDEIAINIDPEVSPVTVVENLKSYDLLKNARVQTWESAKPKFLEDIEVTFDILGNIVGGIGLVVAAITVFIIIFVNAISRRKFIGILKGIGIHGSSIEISYILQALFYAILGSLLGLALFYGVIKPYFIVNPIDFPFSDGTVATTSTGVTLRIAILLITTVISGYVPAKIVVRGNTLDAILGR